MPSTLKSFGKYFSTCISLHLPASMPEAIFSEGMSCPSFRTFFTDKHGSLKAVRSNEEAELVLAVPPREKNAVQKMCRGRIAGTLDAVSGKVVLWEAMCVITTLTLTMWSILAASTG